MTNGKRKLKIAKEGDQFVVDEPAAPGLPYVGRGRTMLQAVGNWLINNQNNVGVEFEVDRSAQPAEDRRRRCELARR
jgi:hypothetical protein